MFVDSTSTENNMATASTRNKTTGQNSTKTRPTFTKNYTVYFSEVNNLKANSTKLVTKTETAAPKLKINEQTEKIIALVNGTKKYDRELTRSGHW